MIPSPRLGLSIDGGDPPDRLREIAELADAGEPANIWIACHLFQREPIACAAAILAATRRVGVVLMALSPYTVHPVYAAMAAATLDEYYPGRVQLCFGVGAPRDLEAVGIAPERPLRTLREALDVSRSLLAGERLSFAGEIYRISGRRFAMGAHPISLWLAASGPRMLELAGERADGVVISAGASPAFIRWSLDMVRRGEARGGRTIRKAALVCCSADHDAKAAKDRLRHRLAFVLRGPHHARNLELAGTQLDQPALAEAFAREDWSSVSALITDDVLSRHCAAGTPSQVRQSLEAYYAAGLDEIVATGDQVASALTIMRSDAAAVHVPFQWTRDVLLQSLWRMSFFGTPVSTLPGHALTNGVPRSGVAGDRETDCAV
jgi:5,10-methylenetetrahydromethanopterin reductase